MTFSAGEMSFAFGLTAAFTEREQLLPEPVAGAQRSVQATAKPRMFILSVEFQHFIGTG